jgi:SNF2 family DNA or RNA helicase
MELREKLQSRMLRREKKDVLDLPDKQHIIIRLDMNPLQRKLYNQMRDELRVDAPSLDDGELVSANAMTKMLRLKQICGTAAAVPGQPDDSAKLDRAVEMVKEMIDSNEPVVIFTQFREILARMVERLEFAGMKPRMLHGDIPAVNRVPIVRAWTEENERGNAQPIVCMFQVAGVGLNMTSARRLIFLDKLYVPKLNEQAEDRLHRIGADKTQPIQIFHLHMRNTIDSRIEAILKRKSDIFDTLVATDTGDWKKKLIAAVLADEDDDIDVE